jgi:hypothetical protein
MDIEVEVCVLFHKIISILSAIDDMRTGQQPTRVERRGVPPLIRLPVLQGDKCRVYPAEPLYIFA